MGLLAFVVLFGYALARPATESMFLARYDADRLPAAWLAVALTAVVVVAAFNRAAARLTLGRVAIGAVALSAASLVMLVLLDGAGIGGATFALYVWKDVHIVVILECLWSFASLVFADDAARWAYGLFCAAGSLGGVAGNLAVGALAAAMGTEQTLWFALPLFALDAALIRVVARRAGHPAPKPTAAPRRDWQVIRDSRLLPWMIALIGLVQVVLTLLDFVFNEAVAAAYPLLDTRTEIIGRVYAAIDGISFVLQLGTGLLTRALGLRRTLVAIPLLLTVAVAALAVAPRFPLAAATKVMSKSLDYSLFRAAKEMLYRPLSYAEKTRGKAIVDVLTYRVAKGVASLLLTGLLALEMAQAALPATVVLLFAWLAVTRVVTRRVPPPKAPLPSD